MFIYINDSGGKRFHPRVKIKGVGELLCNQNDIGEKEGYKWWFWDRYFLPNSL